MDAHPAKEWDYQLGARQTGPLVNMTEICPIYMFHDFIIRIKESSQKPDFFSPKRQFFFLLAWATCSDFPSSSSTMFPIWLSTLLFNELAACMLRTA